MDEQIEYLLAKDDYRSFSAKEIQALQREVRRLRTDPDPDDREGLVEALDWAIEQAEDRGEFLDTDPDFDASRLFDRADALRALRDRLQAQEVGDGDDG